MDFLCGCHQSLKVRGTPRIGDRNDDISFRDFRKVRDINRSCVDPLDNASCNVKKFCAAHFEVQILGSRGGKRRTFIHVGRNIFYGPMHSIFKIIPPSCKFKSLKLRTLFRVWNQWRRVKPAMPVRC